MPELLLDHGPDMSQYIRPDEDGFTIRTRFHGEQSLVDDLARQRSVDPKPRAITKDGMTYRKVGSIPMSVIHKWIKRTGHWPTREEVLEILRSRDFSKLRATEEKF